MAKKSKWCSPAVNPAAWRQTGERKQVDALYRTVGSLTYKTSVSLAFGVIMRFIMRSQTLSDWLSAEELILIRVQDVKLISLKMVFKYQRTST